MKKYILVSVLLFAPFITLAQTVPFAVDLHYGSVGADVTALQEFLIDQGVFTGKATGNFYSITLKAVKAFQTAEGVVPVSGYVGPITRSVINTILSEQTADNEGDATTTQPIIDLSVPQKPTPTQVDIAPINKGTSVVQPVVMDTQPQIAQPVLLLTNNIVQNAYQNSGAVLGGKCSQVVISSNMQAQFENPETHTLFVGTIFPFRPQATNTVETIIVSVNGMSTSTVDVNVTGSLVEMRPAYTFTKQGNDLWTSLENGRAVNPLTGMCI